MILPSLYALLTAILLGFGLEYYGEPSWKMPTGMILCLNGIMFLLASTTLAMRPTQGMAGAFGSLAVSWIGIMFTVAFGHWDTIPVTTILDYYLGPRLMWSIPLPFVWYTVMWALMKVGSLVDGRRELAQTVVSTD